MDVYRHKISVQGCIIFEREIVTAVLPHPFICSSAPVAYKSEENRGTMGYISTQEICHCWLFSLFIIKIKIIIGNKTGNLSLFL